MKHSSLYSFFIHYGMSCVMAVMFVGIVFILNTFEIYIKTNVEIIKTDDEYIGYMTESGGLQTDSALTVHTADNKTVGFKIVNVLRRSADVRCMLRPDTTDAVKIDSIFADDCRLSGTVITGKVRLMQLVFNKWVK